MRRVALIGVPFNSAGRDDGVARAPRALREAGLLQELAPVVAIRNCGDVDVGKLSNERSPVSGLLAEAALVAMIEATRMSVASALDAGEFPLVIGGDCPVMLGCLAAARDRHGSTGLLMMDGHEDGYPPKLSPTGEAADSELFIALALDPSGLLEELRRLIPLLNPDQVALLGPRDEATILGEGAKSLRGVVHLVSDTEITLRGAGRAARDAALAIGTDAASWWLHTDLDVLASAELAAVDYQQPGGLTWEQLEEMTAAALTTPRCAGWTVAIYNPDLDPDETGAARILQYLAGSLAHLPAD